MTMRWRMGLTVMLMMVVAVSASIAGQSDEFASPRIVFVCGHGAAKSVIAAAYFNKLAAERACGNARFTEARAHKRSSPPRHSRECVMTA